MKRDLKNKIAWITGAGSGIGQNAAIRLSALGMKVILSGRNLKSLKETSLSCSNDNVIKVSDISNKVSVKQISLEIEKEFENVDVLINCAGINIENRDWATNFRGRIYVHAGKKQDDFDSTFRFLCERIGIAPIVALMSFSKRLPLGAIIGEVDITGCVTQSESPGFVGPYGFMLANPVLYNQPIPYKGQQRFFSVEIP